MRKIYIFLTIFLTLGIWSCKTKKSVIDKKETETEKVIIEEKKTEEKKQSETETEKKSDKSVIDEWMKIESDKIIITDKDGTVTEIINPRIDKRKSENNESITDKENVATSEENKQNDIAISNNRQIKSDLQQSNSSKGKEPVWLYVVGGCVFAGLGYLILKRFGLV